jgi:hypothetical protein
LIKLLEKFDGNLYVYGHDKWNIFEIDNVDYDSTSLVCLNMTKKED